MRNKKFFALAMVVCVAASLIFGCESVGPDDNGKYAAPSTNLYAATVNSIVGTDALGRSFGEADVYNADKDVGIFYSTWHSDHVGANGIFDVGKLMAIGDPDLWNVDKNKHLAHYWGEPLYGYYASDDPWVIRRHMELFVASGIDYLALDLTNISWYERNNTAIFDILVEMEQAGWKIPKVMGLFSGLPYRGHQTEIDNKLMPFYRTFYQNSKYDKIWYRKGDKNKPVIAFDMKNEYPELSFELKNFFCFRNLMWPFDEYGSDTYNDMAWMDWCREQTIFNVEDKGMMSVSVAQHSDKSEPRMSKSVDPTYKGLFYNRNRGRGWVFSENAGDFANHCNVSGTNDATRALEGTNLQNQWDYAIAQRDKLSEVLVTGWNEWIAFKEESPDGQVSFCDLVNMEFSRDIEMMKGGYGDNFYMQNAMNVRKFKSTSETVYRGKTGTPELSEATWSNVRTYLDMSGDALERNWYDATRKEKNLVNNTNNNDIVKIEMVNDENNLYIRVTTKEDINLLDKDTNLNVLISTKNSGGNRWNGYDYVLCRDLKSLLQTSVSLERVKTAGAYSFEKVSDCSAVVLGKTLSISIPLTDLGIASGRAFTLDFKVADGMSDPSDIMNYYVDGDSAPIGRLNYRYNSGV